MLLPVQFPANAENAASASIQLTQCPARQGIGEESSSLTSMEGPDTAEACSFSLCDCFCGFLSWFANLLDNLFGSSTDEVPEIAPIIRQQVTHHDLIQCVDQCFREDCDRIDLPYPIQVVTEVKINTNLVTLDLGTIEGAPGREAYQQAFRERLTPLVQQVDLERHQHFMLVSVHTRFFHVNNNHDLPTYSTRFFPHDIQYVLGRPQPNEVNVIEHNDVLLNVIAVDIGFIAGQDRDLKRRLGEFLIPNHMELLDDPFRLDL